jgi:hypothetical protein
MSNRYLPVIVLEVSVVSRGAELTLVLGVADQVVQVNTLKKKRRSVQADLLLLRQFAADIVCEGKLGDLQLGVEVHGGVGSEVALLGGLLKVPKAAVIGSVASSKSSIHLSAD